MFEEISIVGLYSSQFTKVFLVQLILHEVFDISSSAHFSTFSLSFRAADPLLTNALPCRSARIPRATPGQFPHRSAGNPPRRSLPRSQSVDYIFGTAPLSTPPG
ncbi:MAG: hypothetical protein ABFD14_03950 [Anaerolineaceae bacterium]